MNADHIIELMSRRQRQILVHSYLYYDKNSNLIDDSTWSKWAEELVELQYAYPERAKKTPYYEQFLDFDASTGFNLDFRRPEIISRAEHLLAYSLRKD